MTSQLGPSHDVVIIHLLLLTSIVLLPVIVVCELPIYAATTHMSFRCQDTVAAEESNVDASN
jgi:hypothetical protein